MGAVVGRTGGAGAGNARGAGRRRPLVARVGTVFAIGLGAAAALGLGGAAAGAKAGDVTEHALDVGVPKDDVQLYHDLLRQGHSPVIGTVDTEEQAATAQSVFKQQGSEDIDRARKELGKAA